MDPMNAEVPKVRRLDEVSPAALLTRREKLAALQAKRLMGWVLAAQRFPAPVLAPVTLELPHLLHRTTVPIARADPDAHPLFEAGKRHNVALAARAFDARGVPVIATARASGWLPT